MEIQSSVAKKDSIILQEEKRSAKKKMDLPVTVKLYRAFMFDCCVFNSSPAVITSATSLKKKQ